MGLVSVFAWLVGGALLLLAAWALRRGAAPMPGAQVVLRLPLEPRRTIYVVSLGGRNLVVGGSDQGLSLLAELDEQAMAQLQPAASAPPKGDLASLLSAWTRT